MTGFSLVPGMPAMPIPQMKSNGLQGQGMNLLKAALAQQAKMPGGGAPAGPAVGESSGPGMPMQIAPTGGAAGGGGGLMSMLGGGMGGAAMPGAPPGLLGALMSKLRPPAATGPIDPNTGLPVTADVLAGAAGMGGPGPAPNALSGLW